MTNAKWSMMIGAAVVASSVFAGAAFAADASHKAGPAAVQVVKDQKIVFTVKLSKAALASPDQLQAELDAAVAAGSITRAEADIMFHKITTGKTLMTQSEKFSVELSKAGLSSPEQLQAELDQRVADGLITREQADILFTKVAQDRGW